MTVEQAALLGVALGVAVVDIALIVTGHEPVSTVIRRSPMLRTAALLLAARLAASWRHDPLTLLGQHIPRRS